MGSLIQVELASHSCATGHGKDSVIENNGIKILHRMKEVIDSSCILTTISDSSFEKKRKRRKTQRFQIANQMVQTHKK